MSTLTDLDRDHLFISYATEDGNLAEWLTLKLTAEGYRVWCDRVMLLGGESYPRDIDRAIKDRTFRMIALLSKPSLAKPNPLKERTLGLNIAKSRGVDFLIPLNVDGLSPTDLDWMVSDLSYISFQHGWAGGFAQLLKKLASIDAPRTLPEGRSVVTQWFFAQSVAGGSPERLWSNLVPIRLIPRYVLRVALTAPVPAELSDRWVRLEQGPNVFWSFEEPPSEYGGEFQVLFVDWQTGPEPAALRFVDIINTLLRGYFRRFCLDRGMLESVGRKDLYFPPGVLAKDSIYFPSLDGSRTHVQAVGERSFRVGRDLKEVSRYHLSLEVDSNLRRFGQPILLLFLHLYMTDTGGMPLPPAKAFRRSRRIRKNWWNREWLARLRAVLWWLADGQESFDLVGSEQCSIVVDGAPVRLESLVSIDESALSRPPVDESELLDDEADDEENEDADNDAV